MLESVNARETGAHRDRARADEERRLSVDLCDIHHLHRLRLDARGMVRRLAAIAALAFFAMTGVPAAGLGSVKASNEISLRPGDDVAKAVEAAPAGTTFHLAAGIYRLQSARPKDRQKFLGQRGVILSGAAVLTGWREAVGLWAAPARGDRLRPNGSCRSDSPMCSYREDLFVDGKIYRRVAFLADVGPGTFFDDGQNVFVGDNPTGKLTEFGATPFAFAGDAEGVLLKDIVVERYASAAQRGAIEFAEGPNWELRNVVARWNHGVGARIGPGARVVGGSYSYNGQLGLGGGFGKDVLIEDVEIAYNNYAGFSAGWEAGGTKFVRADGLVVRNACVHHNDGPGLWTDIDNINVEYVDNLVFENRGDGIKHEISYKARIRGNTVARNGFESANWLWGSQILVQNSRDVEVHGNVVEVRADYGNGISVINQDRGTGGYGPRVSKNNVVHHNTIIHLGASGMSGTVADHGREWFDDNSGNEFDFNTYIVPQTEPGYFMVKDGRARFPRLADYGMERSGKVVIAARRPMRLECRQTGEK